MILGKQVPGLENMATFKAVQECFDPDNTEVHS